MSFGQSISKELLIDAPVSKVWAALTVPGQMKQWMAETEIEIISDWKTGEPFIIKGPWYKTGFENKGTLLAFEPQHIFSYSHLSSLSRLQDIPENYTVLEFRLTGKDDQTRLRLDISNFPTEAIYRHFAFYWNVALEQLRKFVVSIEE